MFPSEITYSVACGSIGHEITFTFEGREWSGLRVNGAEIDLEAQASPGYRNGAIASVVGYGRCRDGQELLQGILVEWTEEGRTVRYRIDVDDGPVLLPFLE